MKTILKIIQELPDYESDQYSSGTIYRGSFQLDAEYAGAIILGHVIHQYSLVSAIVPAIESGSYLLFVLPGSEEVLVMQDELGTRMKSGESMLEDGTAFLDVAVVFDRKGWSSLVYLYLPYESTDLKLQNPHFVNAIRNQVSKKFKRYFMY